jgi:uncharacterized LabA/DUF88 family protein
VDNDPSSSVRIAVLIDADNTSPKYAEALLEELAKYGTPTIKRAYGDFSSQRLSGWTRELNARAIRAIHQNAFTTGKNSTDSALIIDAMDLLYAGNVDGFVIVSSDSDFTRLATRLRESGKTVYGIGNQSTPEAFVKACDRFIPIDLLGAEPAKVTQPRDPKLERLLRPAITGTAKANGWAALSAVGHYLNNQNPGFDKRSYGYATLGELVRAQPYAEVREVGEPPGPTQLWVRLKPRSGQSR